MITIQRYTVAQKTIWDALVDASKNGTFMLKRGYMDYHADRFKDHSLMIYNDDELVALIPVSLHDKELRSHGGLTYGGLITTRKITTQQVLAIFEELKVYMKDNGIDTLLYKRVPPIYYSYPSDEDLYALFRVGAKLEKMEMSSTIYMPDKIKFSERRKRGYKQAAKQGIIIRQTNDYQSYIAILSEVLGKYHNTKPVHTASELQMLAERFPENIHLYAAYKEEKMLAGVVIYETNKVAHAQYIANSDEGKQCGALDAVMNYLINDKYVDKEYFDFGISTENGGTFLNEGLITQKQEFGARGVVYETYKLGI